MLIGFNLAPVVANIYWPQDQWVALLTAAFMVCAAVLLPGFWARIAVLLGADLRLPASRGSSTGSSVRSPRSSAAPSTATEHDRVSWDRRPGRRLDRPAERHAERRGGRRPRPELLAHLHPARPAGRHRADRGEHRARQGGRRDDRRRPRPDTWAGPSGPTASRPRWPARSVARRPRRTPRTSVSWARPGSTRRRPTTSRARVAILLGLCPKFGAIVNATPGGVLGGITVVLYGMIGLVGAKIWVENRVDFGNPVNLVGPRCGAHHRHRQRDLEDHRRLLAAGHRPRHDRGDRLLPPGQPWRRWWHRNRGA